MLIADVAPTAEIQELLVAEHADRSWIGQVTRPLLDADAVRRLLDLRVDAAAVLACCCDVEDLTRWARTSISALYKASYSSLQVDIRDAIGANPACPEWLLWELIDGQRDAATPLAERLRRDAEAGHAPELTRRLTEDHTTVPHWVTVELGERADIGTLRKLLALPGGWRLRLGLEARDDFWDHPDLFAQWLASAFTSRVPGVLADVRCTPAHIGADGIDALTAWLGVHGTEAPARAVLEWVASHAAELLTSRPGATLARAAHAAAAGSYNARTRIEMAFDAADLDVDDDTLSEYLPTATFAGELLRRRGITDPVAWRYLLADADHPGNAGTLAALAAATLAATA